MSVRGQRELWLVALACLGPFVLALLVYYAGPGWLPQLPGSRELVEPPVSMAALPLTPAASESEPARWSLIYARISPCTADCVRHLERLRQVDRAVGSGLDLVRRVYLHAGNGVPELAGEVVQGRIDGPLEPALAEELRAERIANGRIYIADPRGHLVVSYPPDVDQDELLRDIERLLGL
jgi:hypothetical protein